MRGDHPGRSFRGTAAREHALLLALGDTAARVPRAIAVDAEALSACSVTEHIPGLRAPDLGPEQARAFALDLVDALGETHTLGHDAIGRTSSREDTSIERVLGRWTDRFEEAVRRGRRVAGGKRKRAVREVELVGRWLRARLPDEQDPALVHGSYGARRAITDAAGRIVAITGWRWWGVGDPLVDVGWLLSSWDATDPLDPIAAAREIPVDDVLRRYEARAGRSVADPRYYRVLGCWLRAVLGEVRYVERLLGNDDDTSIDVLADAVPALGDRARASIDAG